MFPTCRNWLWSNMLQPFMEWGNDLNPPWLIDLSMFLFVFSIWETGFVSTGVCCWYICYKVWGWASESVYGLAVQRQSKRTHEKASLFHSWNLVVSDCEWINNTNFLLRCCPTEEAKKPWNFSPVFLEENLQYKLSSIAGQHIVCDLCT